MNDKILLGSSFEISLRILLMLSEMPSLALDDQQISAIDFIAVYAADYKILDENLHGYGSYRFSEYPSRKQMTSIALKTLVLDGYVLFTPSKKGYAYKISNSGKTLAKTLTGSYADEYKIAIHAVASHYDISNERNMLIDISQHTIRSLREDIHE